jgi:hypothetical protein
LLSNAFLRRRHTTASSVSDELSRWVWEHAVAFRVDRSRKITVYSARSSTNFSLRHNTQSLRKYVLIDADGWNIH